MVKQLGLENSKAVVNSGEKITAEAEEALAAGGLPVLPAERASRYRSLVMRCAYLSRGRMDICESVKSLARFMSGPTEHSWNKLKRLGRYKPRVIQEFKPQKSQFIHEIACFVDSDHAGCMFTRRSTSGLVCVTGGHCLRASSTIQSTIALSSGETEFSSIVKGAAPCLGLRAMYRDWGIKMTCRVRSDSSAARGMCNLPGLGKTRHVQTRYLWVQHQVKEKEVQLDPVPTSENVSDICAKPVSQDLCQRHMESVGRRSVEGQSVAAKRVA